jgi:hypothetical protein
MIQGISLMNKLGFKPYTLHLKPYTLYHKFLPEIGHRQRTRIEVPGENL